ncbi:DUF4878 domain-containing protein [Micromonospora sp. WMMD812]|uniref:Rv0361 family membrane protein n=1 Tax=Micromonospora sp. WMMD812 TaxID=3015152 RepID=UPI00248C7F11|nr:DUF4878 domain-containing protein [Micromonospora sp. WMMD812]WBB65541.1 DUF4878 domain-containing protein [Micromonospora sp. WMMD812]
MTYEPILVTEQRPRRTGRTVLIVVAVILALCCVGGAVGGFFLYGFYRDNAGPAREAATTYVDDVRAGNYQVAYGRLCTEARAATTQEEFVRIQSAQPKIRSYETVGVNVSNVNGQIRADVSMRMVRESGAQVTQVFPLVRERGEWRVCQ